MFLVLNKDKIYAYLVSVLTVVVLFFVATNFEKNPEKDTTETSTDIVSDNNIYMINSERNAYINGNVSSIKNK